jgi:hypothetical protein
LGEVLFDLSHGEAKTPGDLIEGQRIDAMQEKNSAWREVQRVQKAVKTVEGSLRSHDGSPAEATRS